MTELPFILLKKVALNFEYLYFINFNNVDTKVYGRRGKQTYLPESYTQSTILELSFMGLKIGKGKFTSHGFLLMKDSLIREDHSALKTNPGIKNTKQLLIEESKLIPSKNFPGYYVLQSDIHLQSAGAAGRLIKGYESNGHVDWKNSDGVTLEDLLKGDGIKHPPTIKN